MMRTPQSSVEPPVTWDAAALMRKLLEPLLCVYVYLLILLPSGTILGVNVKIICFLLLLFPVAYHLIHRQATTLRHLSLLLLLPAALALWVILSQVYGFTLALAVSQYREIMIMFASAWFAAVYFSGDDRAHVRFLQMVLHAEVTACVLKVLLLAYCTARGISVAQTVASISQYTGASLMSMDFESAFGRIQFIADGLIPLCLYILLRYRTRLRVGFVSALLMFILLIVSMAFSFSRYLWGFTVVALLVGFLFGKKDRFYGILVGTVGIILSLSFPFLLALTQLRFSADIAGGSDEPRTLQTAALKRFFMDAPIFGHGFGSYTTVITRSNDLPYVYEVELFALAGQEGLIGLSFMGIVTLYYFRFIWFKNTRGRSPRLDQQVCLTVLLVVWLAAGFLNPMLFSSAAAMSYATIKALAETADDAEHEADLQKLNLSTKPPGGAWQDKVYSLGWPPVLAAQHENTPASISERQS